MEGGLIKGCGWDKAGRRKRGRDVFVGGTCSPACNRARTHFWCTFHPLSLSVWLPPVFTIAWLCSSSAGVAVAGTTTQVRKGREYDHRCADGGSTTEKRTEKESEKGIAHPEQEGWRNSIRAASLLCMCVRFPVRPIPYSSFFAQTQRSCSSYVAAMRRTCALLQKQHGGGAVGGGGIPVPRALIQGTSSSLWLTLLLWSRYPPRLFKCVFLSCTLPVYRFCILLLCCA